MKVYTIEHSSFDWWELKGIYMSRELAHEDLKLFKKNLIDRSNENIKYSFTSNNIRMDGNEHYIQLELYKDKKDWEKEWHNNSRWSIIERDLEEMSMQTKIDKIQKWQKSKLNRENWPHCTGKPELSYSGQLALNCPTCMNIHEIPNFIIKE